MIFFLRVDGYGKSKALLGFLVYQTIHKKSSRSIVCNVCISTASSCNTLQLEAVFVRLFDTL